jgi:NAD-dependent deacetylase
MRPHILFFDESYNEKYYRQDTVKESYEKSDCLIIIGTSIETNLTTRLVGSFVERNLPIIEINPNPSIEVG